MHGNTASWEYGREPKISVLRSEGNNMKVPTTMHGPESGPLTPAEVAERMARTDFIIEEYKTGILDEHEAGAELFHHLFPNEH